MQKLGHFISQNNEEDKKPIIKKNHNEKIKLSFEPKIVKNLDESYLIGAGYDGEKNLAYLKFYNVSRNEIFFWYDNTGHKPYCLSDQSIEDLKKNESLMSHSGLDHLEKVEKYDALTDSYKKMTKIVAKDPLSIGGRPVGCIRDIIKVWEADIRYADNFVYDRNLEFGMPYKIEDEKLIPVKFKIPNEIQESLRFLDKEKKEIKELAYEWVKLLEFPVPNFIRAALDIEVFSPVSTRIPDPKEAEYKIICVSIIGSDGTKLILLLEKDEIVNRDENIQTDAEIKYFKNESELITEVFDCLLKYPMIITFNGDDFDLRYLFNRATKHLGFEKEDVPIELGRDHASLTYGIHIDLYRFFFNRSIQIYAFGQKYRGKSLDEIGTSLINMGKTEIEKPISELSYSQLATYCYRDSEITLNLTKFNDELLMKLILLLSRIGFMSVEDVTRQGVSGWIRSMLYREHKKRNYLIPRQDEILELKGMTVSESIIKGKKYKGAMVVEPVPGLHFNVSVLDFASLYPSVIKIWNLGYETINCPHKDDACKANKVPDMSHWICKKNYALESLLIGSLRDLRVNLYKPKLKDPNLPKRTKSWYKVISDGLKVILNASYGVFGADKFALYCPPVAETTAAIGRHVIKNSINKAQSLGIKVLYGDTDSIFLESSDTQNLEKLIDWSKNSMRLELEVDKEYRYIALSSRKKNYLGVYHDGNVDIKGLTGKKRHIPKFLKDAFYEMIERLSKVKSEEEFERAKKEIKSIVKKCYLQLKNHEHSLEDLAFNIAMSKPPERYTKTTPQHVKAARLLSRKGIEVKSGDIIQFVKVRGDIGVKPVSQATISEIDIQKYIEYIDSIFEQVLDSLGLDFQELIGATKLETFF